jgi:hypothetical protein
VDLQELLDLALFRFPWIAFVTLKIHDDGRPWTLEDVVRAFRAGVFEAEAFGEHQRLAEAHVRRGTPCSFDQLRAPCQRGLLVPRG